MRGGRRQHSQRRRMKTTVVLSAEALLILVSSALALRLANGLRLRIMIVHGATDAAGISRKDRHGVVLRANFGGVAEVLTSGGSARRGGKEAVARGIQNAHPAPSHRSSFRRDAPPRRSGRAGGDFSGFGILSTDCVWISQAMAGLPSGWCSHRRHTCINLLSCRLPPCSQN